MASEKPTILSLMQKAAEHLASEGFDEARLHAELLLAHVLRLKRMDLYLQFDRPLTEGEILDFKSAFRRRLKHEPVQYILGETEFMGLPLHLDNRVFIPRPETEVVVEKALEWLHSSKGANPRVLDIGTGSGNIPIAIAHFVPGAEMTSLDVSQPALEVASANIERHGFTQVRLVLGDIFTDIFPEEKFDLILSNPPYISLQEFHTLAPEVRDFEPRIATTDEQDGLRYLGRIAEFARDHLHPDGALFLEIGYHQAEPAVALCRSAGFSEVGVFDDFAGIPRVVRAERGQAVGGKRD